MANTYDSRGRLAKIGQDVTDDQVADAEAKSRMSTTAGAGLGKMEKGSAGAPKQEPGESASSYAARYRKYREGMSATDQANMIEKRK